MTLSSTAEGHWHSATGLLHETQNATVVLMYSFPTCIWG